MKDNQNNRLSVLVTEGDQSNNSSAPQESPQKKIEKLKKPVIFALMAVVFLCSMLLIFKPSKNKKAAGQVGLNDSVPQATDGGLQADKQKAYEQEQLEQKEQEKRSALISLSDYWSEDSLAESGDKPHEQEAEGVEDQGKGNPLSQRSTALNSYRSAQGAIGSFYQQEDSETQELRRELADLKQQLEEKDETPASNIETQLALMEKSYQMAAKYLPSPAGGAGAGPQYADSPATNPSSRQKETFASFTPVRKNAVSALYREPTDSAFLASIAENRNHGFYTTGTTQQVSRPKNSVRACIQQTQVVTSESSVVLRLLEPAITPGRTIPQGTELTANAKFENGRLQLKVSSIELDGYFIAVDITIYGLDGQPGLAVPYSPEMNAMTEIAANMSQSAGSSIMMTRSAGQQVAGDLSRGLVQGISGYFSKKIRTPKVTLKAGDQLFLLSKN